MNFKRWIQQASEPLTNWWHHQDNTTPCILISVIDKQADIPDTDDLKKYWMDSDFVIAREMAVIDNSTYYGQAVPHHFVNFGASAIPCALGTDPEYVNKETIWAHPSFSSIEQILDVTLNSNNYFYRTILDVTEKSVSKSADHHVVSLYPLNGLLDICAGLYGTENFMMDMIIKPELVKCAMNHFKELWVSEFRHVYSIVNRAGSDGGIGWAGIWAPGTTFPIQEDASYMISPEMFKTFCLPHLYDIIDCMDYPLYHLDGIGALPHLDLLLQIEKLKAIQWVPGAGKEEISQWYELIKHIISRGKSVQVFADADEVEGLIAEVGAKGLLITIPKAGKSQAEKLAKMYNLNIS